MNCFIDGSRCPRVPEDQVFTNLVDMEQVCKFCSQASSENDEFVTILENFGANYEWWEFAISSNLQDDILDLTDDVLKQTNLLKKFIIRETKKLLKELRELNLEEGEKFKKILLENKWWLDFITFDNTMFPKEFDVHSWVDFEDLLVEVAKGTV